MLSRKILNSLSPSSLCIAIHHLKTGLSLPTSFQKMSNANTGTCCSCTQKLDEIPKVDIDPAGVFKYILVKVYDEEKNNHEPSVTIVRGYQRCNYHSDIFDEVQEKLKPLDCEPLGGGRISHDPENRKIHIYGYSQGYGKADHEVTAKIVKSAFPAYTITISDEGY